MRWRGAAEVMMRCASIQGPDAGARVVDGERRVCVAV